MDKNNIFGQYTSVIVVAIAAVIILLPVVYSIFSFVFAEAPEEVEPLFERPDSQYERCVKDADYMRFHHWEMLRDIRVEVVRYGKRGEVGLNKCRECHTSRERFCNRCHNAVSMYPDCFHCHYYP